MNRVVFILVVVVVGVRPWHACDARMWNVTPDGSGDAPTVAAAIDSAEAGDEVVLTPGVYSWSSQASSGESMITLKPNLVLRGESEQLAILDAENKGRVISLVDVGDAVRLQNLTIANGSVQGFDDPCGAGVRVLGVSSPVFKECLIRDNVVASAVGAMGGGVYCETATFENCTFMRNEARGFDAVAGGGIYGGAVIASNCTFADNGAWSNGGDASGGAIFGTSDSNQWQPQTPLLPGTTYFWRMSVVDFYWEFAGSLFRFSPIHSFTTQAAVAVEEIPWSTLKRAYRE